MIILITFYNPTCSSSSPIFPQFWIIWLENLCSGEHILVGALCPICPSSALTAATIALHRGLFSKQPKTLGKKGWLDNFSGKFFSFPILCNWYKRLDTTLFPMQSFGFILPVFLNLLILQEWAPIYCSKFSSKYIHSPLTWQAPKEHLLGAQSDSRHPEDDNEHHGPDAAPEGPGSYLHLSSSLLLAFPFTTSWLFPNLYCPGS